MPSCSGFKLAEQFLLWQTQILNSCTRCIDSVRMMSSIMYVVLILWVQGRRHIKFRSTDYQLKKIGVYVK